MLIKGIVSFVLLLCCLVSAQCRNCEECEREHNDCMNTLDPFAPGFVSHSFRCQKLLQIKQEVCQKEQDERMFGQVRREKERQRDQIANQSGQWSQQIEDQKNNYTKREKLIYDVLKEFFSSIYSNLSNVCQQQMTPPMSLYSDYYDYILSTPVPDPISMGNCVSGQVTKYAQNEELFYNLMHLLEIPKKDWPTAERFIWTISAEYSNEGYQLRQQMPWLFNR